MSFNIVNMAIYRHRKYLSVHSGYFKVRGPSDQWQETLNTTRVTYLCRKCLLFKTDNKKEVCLHYDVCCTMPVYRKKERRIRCRTCRTLVFREVLRDHLCCPDDVPKVPKPTYACNGCNKIFTSQGGRRRHEISKHHILIKR